MQNINTTYSPSDPGVNLEISGQDIDWVCLQKTEVTADSVITLPLRSYNPQVVLQKQDILPVSLVYTVVFMIIFAFIRLRGKGLIVLLLHVLVKRKKAEIILNEGITPNLACYVLALLLSLSILSISAVYLLKTVFTVEYSLYAFGFLLLYHFFALTIIRLAGWTFNSKTATEEITVHLWTYNILGGLLISPIVIATFFVKGFSVELLIKIITFCLILFYIVKLIRWIEILFAHRVLILYMILYLCALEVMPLFILYKILA